MGSDTQIRAGGKNESGKSGFPSSDRSRTRTQELQFFRARYPRGVGPFHPGDRTLRMIIAGSAIVAANFLTLQFTRPSGENNGSTRPSSRWPLIDDIIHSTASHGGSIGKEMVSVVYACSLHADQCCSIARIGEEHRAEKGFAERPALQGPVEKRVRGQQ